MIKEFVKGKAAVFIDSSDAVDLCDSYDSFVLLSGDGDFESLIKYLKGRKKHCIVMSTKGHISIELLRQAKFIDFKKIKDRISL